MPQKFPPLRLGVNIDHVATVRNARGGTHPDVLRAAETAIAAGADGITVHLREDRRHITDRDLDLLMTAITAPLNLEMAATDEMLQIALRHKPHAVCLVPERREERTTEGGLDVVGSAQSLMPYIAQLRKAGIRVSLFINSDENQVTAARSVSADIVELHTGPYAHAPSPAAELKKLQQCAMLAAELGLECHAGHGLNFANVGPVAAIPQIVELNIGHFLIGEAIFTGLGDAIETMREKMDLSRNKARAIA